MFSSSGITYHVISWVISQDEVVRDAGTLLQLEMIQSLRYNKELR